MVRCHKCKFFKIMQLSVYVRQGTCIYALDIFILQNHEVAAKEKIYGNVRCGVG